MTSVAFAATALWEQIRIIRHESVQPQPITAALIICSTHAPHRLLTQCKRLLNIYITNIYHQQQHQHQHHRRKRLKSAANKCNLLIVASMLHNLQNNCHENRATKAPNATREFCTGFERSSHLIEDV